MYWWAAMAQSMPVLVAPDAFAAALRAPVVAAAIGRGLERAGVSPLPDLCPVAGGGRGTIEVLLPVLGGETGDGFALVEDGGSAFVELGATPEETGRRIAAALAAGPQVVVVCAGAAGTFDGGAGAIEAIEDRGGLRGASVVVLCETRAGWASGARAAAARPPAATDAPRAPPLRARRPRPTAPRAPPLRARRPRLTPPGSPTLRARRPTPTPLSPPARARPPRPTSRPSPPTCAATREACR